MSKDIDYEFTDEIVCPYCGYELTDSWEFEGDEDLGLIECGDCEKEFYAIRNITVSYSTQKAKYGKCPICEKENTILENWVSTIGKLDYMCLQCKEKELKKLRKNYFKELENKNNIGGKE